MTAFSNLILGLGWSSLCVSNVVVGAVAGVEFFLPGANRPFVVLGILSVKNPEARRGFRVLFSR